MNEAQPTQESIPVATPPVQPKPEPIPTPTRTKPSQLPLIIMTILTILSLALSGYLFYQNNQLKYKISQIETAPVQTAPSPSPTSDLMENWEKYTSNTYNYEIKYLKNIFRGELFVSNNGKDINITNELNKKLLELDRVTGLQLYLGIREDKTEMGDYNPSWQKHYEDLNLLEIGQENNSVKKIDEDVISGNKVGIFSYSYGGGSDPQVFRLFSFIEKNEKLYEIGIVAFNKNEIISNTSLFHQILSTFKFTE